MSALIRRPIESVRLSVADVRRERVAIVLAAIGTTLAVIALANIAGLIVGRFF